MKIKWFIFLKMEQVKVRNEKYYSVGYSPKLNKYILANTIPYIMYYEQYYEITKEEYDMFGTKELDDLANSFLNSGTNSDRFLFSGMDKENNEQQKQTSKIFFS